MLIYINLIDFSFSNNDKKIKSDFIKLSGFDSEAFFQDPKITNQIIMDLNTRILDLTDSN